jgi:ribonuclease P protein component
MTAGEHFGKAYKLCSKKQIAELYSKGKVVKAYPLFANLLAMKLQEPVPFQVVLAVPKRLFKRAHDRNYIKRLLREVIRKNKQELSEKLLAKELQLGLLIVFREKKIPDYQEVEQAWLKLQKKLFEELENMTINTQ